MHRPPLGIGRPLAMLGDGVKVVVGSPSWIINRSPRVATVRCRLMPPNDPGWWHGHGAAGTQYGSGCKHAGWPAGGALACACPLAFRSIKIALRLPSWGLARDWGMRLVMRGTIVAVFVP
jgi:hypothetical protein